MGLSSRQPMYQKPDANLRQTVSLDWKEEMQPIHILHGSTDWPCTAGLGCGREQASVAHVVPNAVFPRYNARLHSRGEWPNGSPQGIRGAGEVYRAGDTKLGHDVATR